MRIVLLAGANSVHIIKWANKLAGLGHEISIVTCADHVPAPKHHETISSAVDVVALPYPSMNGIGYYTNAIACRKIISSIAPDIVNAHYASGYGTLARMSRVRPLAISVWGSDVYSFPDKSKWHKRIVTSNLRSADTVLSTSEVMADRVRELLQSPQLDVPVTPFGVDTEKYPSHFNRPESPATISIGLIKQQKKYIYGIEVLIEAISWLVKHHEDGVAPGFHLHIYGDGPARLEFETMVSDFGLSNLISFHGMIPNSQVPEVLEQLDIYAIPSIHESFGVAAVEAMAAGLPVIASDAPGLLEIIEHDVSGVIVKSGDAIELARALHALMNRPEKRKALGAKARSIVEQRFEFTKNAECLVDALAKTIAKSKA